MKIISAGMALEFAPKVFLATIVFVVLSFVIVVAAAMIMGYVAIDGGHVYYSPERLVRVYGKVVDPAEISYEQRLISGFEAYANPGKKTQKQIAAEAKEAVIRREIMAAEALNRGLTATDKEVETELENRAKSAPHGMAELSNTLESYHWTLGDLKNQIYQQLLEKKVQDTVEGKTIYQLIILSPNSTQLKQALAIADQVKKSFLTGKSFNKIAQEASTSAFLSGDFSENSYELIVYANSKGRGLSIEVSNFLQSLQLHEAKIFAAQNGLVYIAYVTNKNPGPKFATWYEETKRKALSLNLGFLAPGKVYAGWIWADTVGCGVANKCGTSDYTCELPYVYCTWNCCNSHTGGAYPKTCALLGIMWGLVVDGNTGQRLNGVTVSASDPSGCQGAGPHSVVTPYLEDGISNFELDGYNCGINNGWFSVSFVKSGYQTKYVSAKIINGGSLGVNNGSPIPMYPNPPPTTNKYLCNGTSCIQDNTNGWTTDPSCGGACAPAPRYSCNTTTGACYSDAGGAYADFNSCSTNCQPAMVCNSIGSYVSPNPVPMGGQVTFTFTSNSGYTNVSLNTGGGTVSCGPTQCCGNPTGDGRTYGWSWTCQAQSPAGDTNYTATFSSDLGGCTATVGYTVQGCRYPSFPSTPISPTNGANQVPLSPILSWTQSDWGGTPPYSVSTYLSPGTSINAGNYAQCDQGQVTTAPVGCFVWITGPNAGQAVASLNYGTTYAWTVTPRDGCGVRAFDPVWTFTTIPTSYFQTFGGDVTAKGQVTDFYLPANKYVCTKSQ